ncbi:MAG: hypothetical protein ACOC44_00995 [Promethearchaeia archaeon]
MIKELSLFLPNNPGELAKLIKLFSKNNVEIHAISVAETADYGLIMLLVSEPDRCVDLLEENGYSFNANDVLAVRLTYETNKLFDIANILGKNDVNIEYLYSTILRDETIMIVRVDDNIKAENVLKEKNFKLLNQSDL